MNACCSVQLLGSLCIQNYRKKSVQKLSTSKTPTLQIVTQGGARRRHRPRPPPALRATLYGENVFCTTQLANGLARNDRANGSYLNVVSQHCCDCDTVFLCFFRRTIQVHPLNLLFEPPPVPPPLFDCMTVAVPLGGRPPVIQSLLSTVHSSLDATRAAFALRVFVSYDACGRRKDSVVVDIEQPRPLAPSAPHHTIRLLSPVAPLSAITRSATAPLPLAAATQPTVRSPLRSSSSPLPASAFSPLSSPPPPLPSSLAAAVSLAISVPAPSGLLPTLKRARSPASTASTPRP